MACYRENFTTINYVPPISKKFEKM
jgi:hypothetical protein